MEMVLDPWSLTWGLANNPREAPSIALGGGELSEKFREAETPSAPSIQRFPGRFQATGIHRGPASYNAQLLSYPPALRGLSAWDKNSPRWASRHKPGHPDPGMDPGRWPLLQGWQAGLGQALLGWVGETAFTQTSGLLAGIRLGCQTNICSSLSSYHQEDILEPWEKAAHAPLPNPPCLLCPPQGMQGVQGRGSNLLSSVLL